MEHDSWFVVGGSQIGQAAKTIFAFSGLLPKVVQGLLGTEDAAAADAPLNPG